MVLIEYRFFESFFVGFKVFVVRLILWMESVIRYGYCKIVLIVGCVYIIIWIRRWYVVLYCLGIWFVEI